MNERIIKPGVVQRIFDLTKSKNQNYNTETISDILTAFLDVIEDTISKGDSIILNGYMTIEARHRPQKEIYCAGKGKEITIPEQYRAYIKPGSKLAKAAKRYTEKRLGEVNEQYKQKRID